MNSKEALHAPEWDYSYQAAYYHLRPNYAEAAIDALCDKVRARSKEDYFVADVGAGTANLTILLVERGLQCLAIEPNTAMRRVGMERTRGLPVTWVLGTGENTGLLPSSIDLFAMGSSFNCTNRTLTLREAHAVTRPGGYFTCLWNHRDLQQDPVQRRVEKIIREEIPDYQAGSRRQDQTPAIVAGDLFTDVEYFEFAQLVTQTSEKYVEAWKSVRNRYWDLSAPKGGERFARIMQRVREELRGVDELKMRYITKVWLAKRRD
jgi:ubiquinone/menaquinone biosynthesis C-methylase UbiE